MRSLGMEVRPPFPKGFQVEPGDWSLLDAVRSRPKIYRDAPMSQMPYADLSLYIDGEFVHGGGRKEQRIINPATDAEIGKLPHASRADLDQALAAAQRAFQTWRHSSVIERSKILRKVAELTRERAQDIGRHMTMDMGKTLAEAVGEVTATSEHAEWHAEECRRIYGRVIPARTPGVRNLVLREPVGVVRRVLALELPLQPGHPQDRRRGRRGLHDHHQGRPRMRPAPSVALAQPSTMPGCRRACSTSSWGVPARGVGLPDPTRPSCARSPSPARCRWASSWPALAGARMKRRRWNWAAMRR